MNGVLSTCGNAFKFQQKIIWMNVIGLFILHFLAVFGVILFHHGYTWKSWIVSIFMGYVGGLGVTAGAHRLWNHRSYKAKLPLRIFLMFCFMAAGQYSMVQWCRDHRLHHKHSDTDADPHNSNRGFFFSHCGWLMMKRHPDVKLKGKEIDVSDLWADPVVAFHQKYFVPLIVLSMLIPSLLPILIWNETYTNAFFIHFCLRYITVLNITWCVNSVLHYSGTKPYNSTIAPTENIFVSLFVLGEGYHNFHHTFPWDYRTSEKGKFPNLTVLWIHIFEKLGLAYDLKEVPQEMVEKVLEKNKNRMLEINDLKKDVKD